MMQTYSSEDALPLRRMPSRTTLLTVLVPLIAVLLLASLLLTNGDPVPQFGLVLGGAAVVIGLRSPAAALCGALAALSFPLLVVGQAYNANAVRLLALPFIAALVIAAMRTEAGALPAGTWRVTRYALPTMAVFGMLSIFWSIDQAKTANATAALIAGGAMCFAVARTLSMDQITRILAVAGWLAVAASILLFVAAPGLAVTAGRLHGVFVNANGLAAFLSIATPAMLVRLRRLSWPAGLGLLALCIPTGSRAGTAALVLELAVLLIIGRSGPARSAALLAGLGGGAALAMQALPTTTAWTAALPLLRTNNSRADTWAEGLRLFADHPLVGVGLSAIPSTAGQVPQMLATGGVVGLALATIFVVAAAAGVRRAGPLYVALVVGGITDAIFEPWLFTAGSAYCVIFWLIVTHPQGRTYRPDTQPERSPSVAVPSSRRA
jgi:hypothetical protein